MFQDFAARQFAFSHVEAPRRPAVEEATGLTTAIPISARSSWRG